jgi:phosphonate transport system ATP-binding protein
MAAPEASVMAVLVAKGLAKAYDGRQVLVDGTLRLSSGELVVVLGASGSGKTTLFRCLTRLTEPDAGSIEIDGKQMIGLRGRELARARRKVGVVFQQFNLIRRLTALDNVLAGRLADASLWRVMTRNFSAVDVKRAIDALAVVGLADHLHQRSDTLSGGQQQRVAIARAIAQQSNVLLADEPVASLDPETASAILELLKNLARTTGLSVLCTLHQPQLAEQFADRILVMEQGRLRASEPTRHEFKAQARVTCVVGPSSGGRCDG